MRFEFDGKEARVALIGELTFTDHAVFRDILTRLIQTQDKKITIDLSQLDFVDSAGLGMLLIARDEVGKANRSLTLDHPQKQVDRMFAVTKFDSLFTIQR
jgi:anti-anti-sigma factor